jgi:CheY-like chemotaxis protein
MAELGTAIPVICIIDSTQLLNRLEEATTVPDVLFLDVNMPMKNGLDCLTEIKQDGRFNKLPVVCGQLQGSPRQF